MPWVPWIEGIFQSHVHKGEVASSTTARASTSIVLLALVDGDSKFLWVNMGAAGSTSDAQIFKHTNLRHKIENGSIGFPDSESQGIGGPKVNFFFLGDDTFPLLL